jgi:hypothetical protein
MSQTCAQHPDRAAEGNCQRCGKTTCSMCKVDMDGSLFCSMLCFTEGPSTSVDPLAGVGLDASSSQVPKAVLDDDSVVLPASQGTAPDSETSILDMGNTSAKERDDAQVGGGGSSVMDVPSLRKDNTSILGMEAIAKPQGAAEKMPYVSPGGPASDGEPMMPLILPSTRRATIQSNCVFHPDTPAVVLCFKCSDPICTVCVEDSEHGGRCSPQCRRDAMHQAAGQKSGLLTAAVAAAALVVAAGIFFIVRKPEETPPVKTASMGEISKPDPAAEAKAKSEAEAKAAKEKSEAEAAAKAAAEMKAKEEAEAKAKAEKEAKEKAEAEAMAAKAATEKKAKEEAEAKAKAEKEAKERGEAEAMAKAAAEKKAKEETEAKAAAEKKVKEEAEAKAKAEREAKEKEEARLKAEAMAAKAKAEAEARAKEEARLNAEAEARAKVEAEAKAKEEARLKADAEAKQLETSLLTASTLIREATPDFKDLALQLNPGITTPGDIRKDSARAAALEKKLADARTEYERVLAKSPDREKLQWRIDVLSELIEALDGGLSRVKSDRMTKQATQRFNEAMPLYKRFTSKIAGAKDPSERQELLSMGELARHKLDEARSLYRELKSTSREPSSYDIKLSSIDELIESLDGELKRSPRK